MVMEGPRLLILVSISAEAWWRTTGNCSTRTIVISKSAKFLLVTQTNHIAAATPTTLDLVCTMSVQQTLSAAAARTEIWLKKLVFRMDQVPDALTIVEEQTFNFRHNPEVILAISSFILNF